MMKRLHLIGIGFCVLFLSVRSAHAQEIDFTQYYLNLAGVNAGFTGMEDYVDLKLAYRQGGNDFGVKNSNVFVSAYGALGARSQQSLKKNSLRISNMEAFEQLQSNQRFRRRQGIGGMLTSRTVGPYTSVSVNGNYAYHLPISPKLNVSLGTRIAYGSQRVDFNGYTVRDPVNDVFYQQLLQSNPGNQNSVSIDFGTVLYSNRFYLAFSSTNLGMKSLSGEPQLSIKNKRQFSLQTAAILPLGTFLSLNSGLKLTQAEGYDFMWAVNSRLRYKELIYLGAGYSGGSKMSLLFGLAVNGKLAINYAYDHYFTGLSSLNVNVHEVVVGISLFNTYESKSRLW
jgi:type IX secretion system PorP/SprF family membrane protein